MLSFGFEPTDAVDLADEAAARRFVRTYVLPGLDPRLDLDLSTTSVSATGAGPYVG